MQPKRILFVVGRMHYGGIEVMITNLFRNIDREKIVFDFMLNYEEKGAFDDEIKRLGGKIYIMPRLFIKNAFKYIIAVNDFFKKHKEYEIVHGHLTSVGVIYLTLAKLHGVKVTIIHAHTTSVKRWFKGVVERIIMLPLIFCADYYFACSDAAASYCFGKNILKKKNYMTIKNGIELDKFVFAPKVRERKRLELDLQDKFVIATVGRCEVEKNHLFLINVFSEVYKRDKNSVLLIIGDGSLRSQTQDYVKNNNLENCVRFLGVRDDVSELLQAVDLFILPSLYEGLPVIGIEAQATGVKCIFSDAITTQTDVTGNCEFISLENPVSYWADRVLSYKNYDRENTKEKLEKVGYDSKHQAAFLQKFYLEKLEEIGKGK